MRGKKVDINEYIANIEPFMEQGLTMHEACLQADVPYRTVKDYYDNDEEVRKKIMRLEQYAIVVAKNTLMKGIRRDPDLALKYLERKKKDEFSLRQEMTGKDGAELPTPIISLDVHRNDSNKEG